MAGLTGFGAAAGSLLTLLERRGIVVALIVGLLLRVALTTFIHHWDAVPYAHDDATYAGFAKSLIETGRLDTAHFPVGYTLFVASFLKLGSSGFVLIRVAQVLLGLLTIVLVSRIATLLYGDRAGIIAGLVASVYPPLIYMTGRIMSETLFITLLMASIYTFLLADRDQSTKRSALASALFGLASIVRSNLILMTPFVALWVAVKLRASLRERLINAAVCGAVIITILMLPGLYFLKTKGEFIPFSTNGGQTFYCANNPFADGGCVQDEEHPELLASIPPEVNRSATALSKAKFHLGLQWIRENPLSFISLLPKKFANAWIPGLQTSETTSQSKLASVVLAFSYGLLLLCAIGGRVLVKPERRDGILLAILGTYTVMSLTFFGGPRYGLTIAPILIVYAAGFLAEMSRRSLAGRETRSFRRSPQASNGKSLPQAL